MNTITFLIRRGKQYYRLLITLLVGVILSISLITAGPLLVDTVLNASLPFALRGKEALDGNIQISLRHTPEHEVFLQFDRSIRNIIENRLGIVDYRVSSGSVSPFLYPWIGGQLIRDQRVNLAYRERISNDLVYLQGDWPKNPENTDSISAVIGEAFSLTYSLEVEDILPLSLKISNAVPDINIKITGVAAPTHPEDINWYGEFNPFRNQASKNYIVQYSVLLPVYEYFRSFDHLQPGAQADSYWNVLINAHSLKASEIDRLLIAVELLRNELNGLDDSIKLNTNLDSVLLDVKREAASIQIPLYLLVLEIVLLSIYYLVMVAGLYTKQLEGEFSRLGSRGASINQVFGIQTVEAGLISFSGFFLGPITALLLISGFLYFSTFTYKFLSVGDLAIPIASWIAAGIGGIVSIFAITIPAISATRKSVVVYLQDRARQEKPPFWQRYYLDVLILIGAIVLFLRVQSTGGFINIDWLLLFAPLGLLIGASTILLRLLPPILNLISKGLDLSRGLSISLAVKHAARNPNYISRLVLLLTLTMALGMLATGLSATLEMSESQRARYAVGADTRMSIDGIVSPQFVEDQPAVISAAGAWRSEASINVRVYRSFPTFEMLAIEPYSMADVTRFRSDFSDERIGYLLGKLVTDVEKIAPVLTLPGGPVRIGMWLSSDEINHLGYNPLEYLSLQTKIRSNQNFMVLIDLDLKKIEYSADYPGLVWGYFEGIVPEMSEDHFPLGVHTIWLRAKTVPEGDAEARPYAYMFSLDDISIIDQDNQLQVIESFEDAVNIWQTNDPEMTAAFSRRRPAHTGEATVGLRIPNRVNTAYSFSLANTEFSPKPLPVLISDGFFEQTGLAIGDRGIIQLLGTTHVIEIVGNVNYFPTLYDRENSSYLITAYTPLLNRLNILLPRPINLNEIWASLEGNVSAEEIWTSMTGVSAFQDSATEQAKIMADPLSLGLRGVTTLGTIVTFVLSLIGFFTYMILSVKDQISTFGVLRSLGLSKYQLYAILLVEQFTLIFVGLLLGVILGYVLNLVILPDLPVRLGGIDAVPPFIPQENWNVIIRLIVGLVIAYLCVLVIGVFSLYRMKVHRVLRVGDE